jgi:hypothetical protein
MSIEESGLNCLKYCKYRRYPRLQRHGLKLDKRVPYSKLHRKPKDDSVLLRKSEDVNYVKPSAGLKRWCKSSPMKKYFPVKVTKTETKIVIETEVDSKEKQDLMNSLDNKK